MNDNIRQAINEIRAALKPYKQAIERIKFAIKLVGEARKALDMAINDPDAPIGLQIIAFSYFQHLDDVKSNHCFQIILEKVSRKLRWFKYLPLELPSEQKAEKEAEIAKALWEHISERQYEKTPFMAIVNLALQGEFDAIIITAVANKIKNILSAQRAKRRGAQFERVEFDEKYAEQARFREDGKIDEAYQNAISVDFTEPIDIEDFLTDFRQQLSKLGNEILTYSIEYWHESGELPPEKALIEHFGISARTVRRYRKKFQKNENWCPIWRRKTEYI